MIAHKKIFYTGLGMMASFIVILCIIFSPVFKGQTGLEYLDSLYNSISKGSAYYIPDVKKEAENFSGNNVRLNLVMATKKQAKQTVLLFQKAGVQASASDAELAVEGDLGKILAGCLEDADLMYMNEGEKIKDKYGYNEKQVLYNWYKAFKSIDKELKDQKKFKEAKIVALTVKKAVECAYNYYQIKPLKITDSLGIVIFSLIFYVIYTLWYGFAVMYMFEGWGMNLEH